MIHSAYGSCSSSSNFNNAEDSGEKTSLYLSLQQGLLLLVAFRICMVIAYIDRDPIAVIIKGNNELISTLTLGASCTLIYK